MIFEFWFKVNAKSLANINKYRDCYFNEDLGVFHQFHWNLTNKLIFKKGKCWVCSQLLIIILQRDTFLKGESGLKTHLRVVLSFFIYFLQFYCFSKLGFRGNTTTTKMIIFNIELLNNIFPALSVLKLTN